jgi:hypothetical protein
VWQNFEKQKLLGVSEKLKENKKVKKRLLELVHGWWLLGGSHQSCDFVAIASATRWF